MDHLALQSISRSRPLLPFDECNGALRDLMGLLTLPAMWAGKDGTTVLTIMADAVVRIAPVVAIYAEIAILPEQETQALLKFGYEPWSAPPPDWQEFCRKCRESSGSADRPESIPSPLGALRVVRIQLDARPQSERIWFGSCNPDFPSLNQAAFLRAATTLAATGLDAARIDKERSNANRAKDDFLAMLGHELRNPLAPIVNTLELMRLKDCGLITKDLVVIERQVQHLARLVDDLLNITRIGRNAVDLRPERFPLRQAVLLALETCASRFEVREHRIVKNLDGLQGWVYADPERLHQVFCNLFINAAKYTPPHGTITVGAWKNNETVTVFIQDNGSGIEPDLLPKVFDLFEQGDMAIDRAEGGLGVGLALAKKLVEMQSGQISVESAGRGKGSKFSVSFPLVALPQTDECISDPVPSNAMQCPSGKRVLLVDDNTDGVAAMRALLELYGYQVSAWTSPEDALKAAPQFQPQACILDIGLPGMDGYELATRLRQCCAASADYIALTGYGLDKIKAKAAGFQHHIFKPAQIDDLLTALQSS